MAVGIDALRRVELRAAIALFLAALAATLIANSGFGAGFHHLLAQPLVNLNLGGVVLRLSLHHIINDGLMAIFFFVIGLELKKELIEGALSHPRKAAQPFIAAAAGMIVPALIFASFTFGDAQQLRGWAVPAATDIAFALGALALLGRRVRSELRIFLLAVAVADDLGAILVIALFYASGIKLLVLGAALALSLILIGLNRIGVRYLSVYLILGAVVWLLMFKSGVHATLAGVLVAFAIPHRSQPSLVNLLQIKLHGFVSYIVLPLFALANAGVAFNVLTANGLTHPITLGAGIGLIVGKPLGIFSALYASTLLFKLRPIGTAREILGVSCLAGIGFTMSLFIGSLGYSLRPDYFSFAQLGILIGSIISGIIGYLILRSSRIVISEQQRAPE